MIKAKCNIPDCPYICRSRKIITIEDDSLNEDEDGNMFYDAVCYQCKPAQPTKIPYEDTFEDDAETTLNSCEQGDVKIGNACKSFVLRCNEIEHSIRMITPLRNNASAVVTITIHDENAWNVAKQLVSADGYPIIIKNPREKGPLNMSLLFERTKGDNREIFYRHVYTTKLGKAWAYELRSLPKTAKKKKALSKSL